MSVRLGITLPVFTDDLGSVLESARRAEDVGLDSIWVFDHLWPLSGGKERPILECWSTLGWLAAATERITVGTLVTRSTLRNPLLLARMVDTVGAIAPERAIVTIGSGDAANRAENEAFGLPYHAGPARAEQLSATVAVVVAHLHGKTEVPLVTGSAPRVWVAGRAHTILQVAGTQADGWNGWGGTPERFEADAGTVRSFGRDVEITWAGLVMLAESGAAARERLGGKPARERIVGGPEEVAASLSRFTSAGAEHLILTETRGWDPDAIGLLASEVRPRMVPPYTP